MCQDEYDDTYDEVNVGAEEPDSRDDGVSALLHYAIFVHLFSYVSVSDPHLFFKHHGCF